MSRPYQNYIIATFLIALLLVLFLLGLTFFYHTYPSHFSFLSWASDVFEGRVILKLLLVFWQFLWLPIILGGYFIFLNTSSKQSFEMGHFLPAFVCFICMSLLTILLQSFTSSVLIETLLKNQWDKEEEVLNQILEKQKDVSIIREAYLKNKTQNSDQYGRTLQQLHYEFPTDFNLAKSLREFKVEVFERQWVSKKAINKKLENSFNLESSAIALINLGDYLGAAKLYQKLIKFYPNTREFKKKRIFFQDRFDFCFRKGLNREFNLPNEGLEAFRINQELKSIKELWQGGYLYKALGDIMQLRVDYQENDRVITLYNAIINDWHNNEFDLTPLIYQKQKIPQKTTYTNVTFTYKEWSIEAKKIYPYSKSMFLEGLTIHNQQFNTTQKYVYGELRHKKLFLKNGPYTRSLVIKGDFSPLIDNIVIEVSKNKFLFLVMGVPDLLNYLAFAKDLSRGDLDFYQWLINLKINYWILGIGLFFLLAAFSWHSRASLFSFWSILALFYILAFSLGLYMFLSYMTLIVVKDIKGYHFISSMFSIILCMFTFIYFFRVNYKGEKL